MSFRIGIDVGGTFTDFLAVDPDGSVSVWKNLTTPEDQSLGVMQGLETLGRERGLSLPEFLERTEVIVHGTTTADNTMIEMSGARVGLLVTQGRRDELEFRRGFKEDIWNPRAPGPPTIVPRRYRLGVEERLDFEGNVLLPLDEEQVRTSVRRLRAGGIESIGVVLLFSFLNPDHEQRVGEIIRQEAPELEMVSLSHLVHPAAPEFERTSTTAVNAYVGPRVMRYLGRLAERLEQNGFSRRLFIMQSNGGIAAADCVSRRPVVTLGSGPAGGVLGACRVARESEIEDFISIDMGGTSYEVCLVQGGEPSVNSSASWVHRYLIALPMVDVVSIGAGGGSIARVEDGSLRVGPESAGASPGPICFGRGGALATVTDAHLVLGYLSPEAFAASRLSLHSDGVAEAIAAQVGRPLGLDAFAAAWGIYRLANANMNNAIIRASAERGHDPRDFALVVFGGNGPLHAMAQAEELGIGRVLVPRTAPALSALGLLGADYLVERVRAHIATTDRADLAALEAILRELEADAESEIVAAGLRPEALVHQRFAQCRYPGQTWDLDVPMGAGALAAGEPDAIAGRFHARHEQEHTFARREEEVLISGLRVRSRVELEKPALPTLGPSQGAPKPRTQRDVWFGDGFVRAEVYEGRSLAAGHEIVGPAIIEEPFTTLVIPPDWTARLDGRANFLLTRSPAELAV